MIQPEEGSQGPGVLADHNVATVPLDRRQVDLGPGTVVVSGKRSRQAEAQAAMRLEQAAREQRWLDIANSFSLTNAVRSLLRKFTR